MKRKLIFILKLLALLVLAFNLIILLSGRFYLYKGIYHTYLQGKTGPSIYDLALFSNAEVKKGNVSKKFFSNTTDIQLTQEESDYLNRFDTKSFLIIRNDTILVEKYFDKHQENTLSNSFSAAKTVVGLLIGCAIEDGKIKSVDESIAKYLPEFRIEGKEQITIENLLTMSSGLNWGESSKNPFSENAESYYGTDLFGLVNRLKVVSKPGETFSYKSGDTQILAFILEKATGQSLHDYASEKIWSKIGASQSAYWSLDKENGDEKAYCCLYATTRDFAKLGQLLLQDGKWNDEQIIPAWYLKKALSPTSMNTAENIPNTRYGYQIWLYPTKNETIRYCRGILGQYIIAIPSQKIVIVRTGMKRAPNFKLEEISQDEDFLKIGHPKDLFEYLKIAKRITSKS